MRSLLLQTCLTHFFKGREELSICDRAGDEIGKETAQAQDVCAFTGNGATAANKTAAQKIATSNRIVLKM